MYDYPVGRSVPPDISVNSPGVIHGPQGGWYRSDKNKNNEFFNSPVDYMLHLIYTPIVTLHNPYNIPLDFTNLRVEMVNVPFAIQIFRKRLNEDSEFVSQTNRRSHSQ